MSVSALPYAKSFAVGGLIVSMVASAGWAATAHTGVELVVSSLSAEKPELVNIHAESTCPFLISATFERDYRGDGKLMGQGSARFLWFPGFVPRELSRDGPYIYCSVP